jgi:hypothetical protein
MAALAQMEVAAVVARLLLAQMPAGQFQEMVAQVQHLLLPVLL